MVEKPHRIVLKRAENGWTITVQNVGVVPMSSYVATNDEEALELVKRMIKGEEISFDG